MPRFKLRTLLIVMALLPPLLAAAWPYFLRMPIAWAVPAIVLIEYSLLLVLITAKR